MIACTKVVLVALILGLSLVSIDAFECREAGFFRDPANCDKFIRCYLVRGLFKAKTFDCAPGTVFDSKNSICNYAASATPPCSATSTTTTSAPLPADFVCPSEGVFEDEFDCTQFWLCEQSGYELKAELLACPGGFVFDKLSSRCTYGSTINCTTGGSNRRRYTRARKLNAKQAEKFFAQRRP